MEDSFLVSAAVQGDSSAITALVERYRGYVYTIAYKITLHEDDALDVAQTVFLRLVERIGEFNGRGPFKGWIAAIAANEAISHRRRAYRRHEEPTDPEVLGRIREGWRPGQGIHVGGWDAEGGAGALGGGTAGPGGRTGAGRMGGSGQVGGSGGLGEIGGSGGESPRELAARSEQRERIEAAMGDLSPQQRAIFALRFREDMDSKEIAERLGLAPGQVRVQLCRAVARLRELVGQE